MATSWVNDETTRALAGTGWQPRTTSPGLMSGGMDGQMQPDQSLVNLGAFADAFKKAGFNGPMFVNTPGAGAGEAGGGYTPMLSPEAQAFADSQGWQMGTQDQGSVTNQGLFDRNGNVLQQQAAGVPNDSWANAVMALGAGYGIGGLAAGGLAAGGTAGGYGATAGGGAIGGAADYGAGSYAAGLAPGTLSTMTPEVAAGVAGGTAGGTVGTAGAGSSLGDLAKYGQYVAPLVGAYIGNQAAGKASDAQVQAGREANATTLGMYNQNRADLEPWRTAGGTALGQLSTGTAPGGDFNRDFTRADFQADPGYQFRMDQGNQAIERSAAARGGLVSGATGKALTEFGQNTASGEFSNAYNRFNNDRTQRFNRLSGIAGTGQTAATQIGQFGANAANNISNTQQGIGNAQASGYIGGSNAINSGLSSLSNLYQQQQWLDRMNPPKP